VPPTPSNEKRKKGKKEEKKRGEKVSPEGKKKIDTFIYHCLELCHDV